MTGRIHKLWPSWLLVAGLVVVFAGERVFAADDTLRSVLGVLAVVLLGGAVVVRYVEWSAAGVDRKPVLTVIGGATIGVASSMILYALIPLAFDGDTSFDERMRGVLWAVWPIVLVSSGLPLLFVEAAVSPVAYIDRYERAQVRRSATRGLSLALFLSALFVGNYLVLRHDRKLELAAGHTATADEQTRRIVRDLTEKVRVVLFFPRANDVAERVAQYFAPLAALNANLEVEQIDHALAFELAKDAGVTENGYVALYKDKATDKIRLGTNYRSSRSALRRFDNSFIRALIKVSTSERTAYFYQGHDERPLNAARSDDQRAPIGKLRKQLETWQFKVKPFSVGEGSAAELPKDGDIMFIVGPEKPFLAGEIEVLKKALDRGLRLFIALEAERTGDPLDELLAPLGLKFDKTRLAALSSNIPLTRTKADRSYVYSNRFSSHRSVTTMTRNTSKVAAIFYGAGSLAKRDDSRLKNAKTNIVLTARPDTFADANDNLDRDPGEGGQSLGLAAAVTITSTVGKRPESRVFVLADADALSDRLIGLLPGNAYFLLDIVRWLEPRQETFAATTDEEDVKIIHKGTEDSLVFYGTTLAIPVLILVVGAFATRRRRRS